MTRGERVAVRRDIRRRKNCKRQHTLGYTPTTQEPTTMDVTITIPKYTVVTDDQVRDAEAKGVRLTQGIGSLFIYGPLDEAVEVARVFDVVTAPCVDCGEVIPVSLVDTLGRPNVCLEASGPYTGHRVDNKDYARYQQNLEA